MTRPFCEQAEKTIYSSRHDAISALTGQLRSKRVRWYRCKYDKSHGHITKEGSTKLHR